MKLSIKQGDTRHAIRATLKNVAGINVDLTSTTVRFKMARKRSGILIDREATIEGDGVVHIVFANGDTDIPGLYEAEFFVSYDDGRVETFPHKGKIEITIENRIGGV